MILLEQFLQSARARGRAPNTLKLYHQVLTELGNLRSLTAGHVDSYLRNQLKINKPSTVNTKLQVIHAYTTWAESAGHLEGLSSRLPPNIKAPSDPPTVATREDVQQLASHLRVKHRLALYLMSDAGLRVSEVVALTTHDVDLVEKTITVHAGKGSKTRLVPITPGPLGDELKQALNQSPAGTYLVPGRAGSRLSRDALNKVLDRACRRAGLPHLNPHAFRHGFAAHAVASGTNVRAVQQALGHSSLLTTENYLRSLSNPQAMRVAFASFAG